MALEGRGFDGRLVCDLVSRGYERPDLEHERAPARISGGFVTHRAYLHAATCAELIAPDKPLLVSVNRINFLQPVRAGDTLHFTSRVTYTGATSICVEVDIVRESSDHSTAALCNTCTFTFRNVDAALGGRPVPSVYPTTYAEDLRYLAVTGGGLLHEMNIRWRLRRGLDRDKPQRHRRRLNQTGMVGAHRDDDHHPRSQRDLLVAEPFGSRAIEDDLDFIRIGVEVLERGPGLKRERHAVGDNQRL